MAPSCFMMVANISSLLLLEPWPAVEVMVQRKPEPRDTKMSLVRATGSEMISDIAKHR
jgi:hypothetical protein